MPFTLDDRPRHRGYGFALYQQGEQVVLVDQLRIAHPPLVLSKAAAELLNFFNGQHTLRDLQAATNLPAAMLLEFVEALDASFYLDSPRFHTYLQGPVRRTSCFAGMPPDQLRASISRLFEPCQSDTSRSPLRAVLVPHMDYARGGVVYGHGFQALADGTHARLFVIIATSHYSPKRFTLTRMDFETPLGRTTTDQAYIDRIVTHYGDGLFDDPLAHLPEHSIELEVAILQHLFADKPFRIVPLLVGSFADCVRERCSPRTKPDIARMIAALQRAESEAGEEVCYVISGDLAHIGQKFDDPDLLSDETLAASRAKDQEILARYGDAEQYFDFIAAEQDARRICGLPPTYVAMNVLGTCRPQVLAYEQYIHPQRTESVSFASVAFQ